MTSSAGRRMAPVHVVGMAATALLPEQDAMLDELVFEVTYAALKEAGLRKQDAGLSVAASMDVLDARSISSGLYTAASGGYLNDSYRIEGDSALAVIAAAEAVAAGDVEVAIAVGVHNPETTSRDGAAPLDFLAQVSNLAFEPHADRPIGMNADVAYGLHASYALEHGVVLEEMAALAADEISRAGQRDRAVRRDPRSAEEVLASTPVAWPLSELMLPAHATGAVAVVLASPARAGRTLGRSARIVGIGRGTGRTTRTADWLTDPGAPTRTAGGLAYRTAGIVDPGEVVGYAEVSAPTPFLHAPYLDALGLAVTLSGKDVNQSGGLRSSYPGLANGALRLLEVVEQLEQRGRDSIGVSHSVDTVTGVVTEDASVLVVEAA